MSTSLSVDVLMITHRTPEYVRLSLPRLLDTCDAETRVWVWHNGEDRDTLGVVESYLDHPRLARFEHSPVNKRLREPTNWLWTNAGGTYVAKVDDDSLVEDGWIEKLRSAHECRPDLGVVGSWRWLDEDFVPELSLPKLRDIGGGHRILENFWVQGTGYLMKRSCIANHGLLAEGQSFTQYCIDLACNGYINGWYYPFIREEHMDDPRSPHTALHTDFDLQKRLPLSAQQEGISTLDEWEARLKRSAVIAQASSLDVRHYRGWRKKVRGFQRRMKRGLAHDAGARGT